MPLGASFSLFCLVVSLLGISALALDCSLYAFEKEIIRSLPLRISINPSPSQFPTVYNYAVVTSAGQVIELTLTNIATVPLPVFCLRNLRSLTLQYSFGLQIPSEISRLANSLVTLNLIGVSQSLTLPNELFLLRRLRSLAIISCGLEALPAAVKQLSSLANLTLTDNRLKALPDALGQVYSLNWLTVDKNSQLTSLDALNGHLSLTTLNAASCAIDHLPRNLSALQTVNVHQNQLTSLDGLDTINYQAKSLVFSNNNISSMPAELTRLQKIDRLDLSNNQLTELPGWVYNVQLQSIDARNNQFDQQETEWIRGVFRSSDTTVNV